MPIPIVNDGLSCRGFISVLFFKVEDSRKRALAGKAFHLGDQIAPNVLEICELVASLGLLELANIHSRKVIVGAVFNQLEKIPIDAVTFGLIRGTVMLGIVRSRFVGALRH